MKTQKQTLRTEFQTKRPTNIREASEAITAQVLASPFYRNAASVFVYVSTPDESDTAEIIKAALADGGKRYP